MKVAILGGGESGSGWAARFVLNGHDVRIFAPGDEQDARRTLNDARASLPAIYDRPLPAPGGMEFAATVTEAVAGADWVQIVGPDLPENILPHLRDEAIVASSTALHNKPA